MTVYIEFEPVGHRGECPAGHSLLDCARQLGVDLVNLCGGAGTCGRCRVRILEGPVSERTLADREGSRSSKGRQVAACAKRPGICLFSRLTL